MKRFLRAILALCMCFTIVLSCAIPQAKAFDLAGAVLYNIAGNIGVNAALRAIGVGPGNSPEAFNNLVNDIANSDIVNTAGQILISGSTGDYKGFLQKSFLQAILDFMFDTGVLSAPTNSYSVSGFMTAGSSTISAPNPFSVYYFYNSARYTYYSIILSAKSQDYTVTRDSGVVQTYRGNFAYNGTYYFISNNASNASPDFPRLPDISVNSTSNADLAHAVISANFPSGFDPSVSTREDFILGSVASSVDSSLYDSWTANGGTYDGGDYIPVSIPSLSPSAIASQTQVQAQAGTIPDAVVEEIVAGSEAVPDTDTGTLAGVIEAIQALPQTLADLFTGIKDAVLSIPQAIADVFSPPAVSESYQISLSSFFPFCIPFDLYNLLDALAAAPEAPVINGVIPVPTFGQTYEIEVDLSPWDNVAALFRTLQLGLFIVGLALVTRERFLRS